MALEFESSLLVVLWAWLKSVKINKSSGYMNNLLIVVWIPPPLGYTWWKWKNGSTEMLTANIRGCWKVVPKKFPNQFWLAVWLDFGNEVSDSFQHPLFNVGYVNHFSVTFHLLNRFFNCLHSCDSKVNINHNVFCTKYAFLFII